jgi:hypothetical protein
LFLLVFRQAAFRAGVRVIGGGRMEVEEEELAGRHCGESRKPNAVGTGKSLWRAVMSDFWTRGFKVEEANLQ